MSPSTLPLHFLFVFRHSIVWLCAALTISGSSLACAHEFPIGHVERSASCLVHDDQLIVEYSIGLHPETMQEIVERWRLDQARQTSKETGKNPDGNPGRVASGEKASGVTGQPDSSRPTKSTGVNSKDDSPPAPAVRKSPSPSIESLPIDHPALKTPERQKMDQKATGGGQPNSKANPKQNIDSGNEQSQPASKTSTSETRGSDVNKKHPLADSTAPGAEAETGDAPSPLDPELLKDFRLAMSQQVVAGLRVTADSSVVQGEVSSAAQSPRHHVDLVVTVRYDLNSIPEDAEANNLAGQTTDLSISDLVFPNVPGGARYSLKSRGDAILNSSNVAPLLLRAERMILKAAPQKAVTAPTFTLDASLALPNK